MSTALIKDSIQPLNEFKNDQYVTSDRKGKLIKGLVYSQSSVPTIPSKYLTVITENNETKGFTRSSKRFQNPVSDTPGPGSYNSLALSNLSDLIKKTSDSKKGYGGFASSSSRNEMKLNPGYSPSASAYKPETIIYKKKDFRSGNSCNFTKPIANIKPKEQEGPGPNEYNLSTVNKHKFKSNNVTANAAFKSHTKREVFEIIPNPAPGAYSPNDDANHDSSKIPFSSFKSTTQRQTFMGVSNIPGPADYRPMEPVNENINRLLFPRRHYLAISAPAIPMGPDLPLPGPGQYEVRDFKEPEKKYMSSAVFVSSTGRNVAPIQLKENPGPANYNPNRLNKNSFHYNIDKKWL